LQFNYFYLYLQPILVANKVCKSLWSRTSFNRKSSAKQGWCVPNEAKETIPQRRKTRMESVTAVF